MRALDDQLGGLAPAVLESIEALERRPRDVFARRELLHLFEVPNRTRPILDDLFGDEADFAEELGLSLVARLALEQRLVRRNQLLPTLERGEDLFDVCEHTLVARIVAQNQLEVRQRLLEIAEPLLAERAETL